ncbi:hypothetical protein GIB67_006471 [Kingdonia uniflora]|uniref:O-acyltransferase WSD1 C-terminal domain-containing protein n=1 Tax=Kingdonia uniflora TaxID=39325 RepID=A0A7J7LEE4_9MAGN|nr:hypothetical protein GIB67_006471 [Kingdonia uniflora]
MADTIEKVNMNNVLRCKQVYFFFPFKIFLRDNILDYVHEAKSTIDRRKNFYATTALFYKCLLRITMGFSNVVGPLEDINFYGNFIAYIYPTASNSLISYFKLSFEIKDN